MKPGENCSAMEVVFSSDDARASFLDVHVVTSKDLDTFVTYYFSRSNNRRIWSILIRFIAVAAGSLAALSITRGDPGQLSVASILAVIAGGTLAFDWAFNSRSKRHL
jgi:hypothetical protein